MPPLIPCPFCGHEAETMVNTRQHFYWVECTWCGAKSAEFDREINAVEAWNQRVGKEVEGGQDTDSAD